MNIKDLRIRQDVNIKTIGSDDTDSIVYISGYASVYRTPNGDIQIDRDEETVNTDNLDLTSYEKNPVVIHNHQWDRVVGKVTKLVKDYRGLYVEAEIHRLKGEEAVYEAVKKGLIRSFSIGFLPKQLDLLHGEILQITSAELIEISLAPVQSNPEALFRVTGTKSLGISITDIAKQNGITNSDIKVLILTNQALEKGKQMQITQKEVEPKPEVVQPVTTPTAEPVVEPKVEPKPEVVKPVTTPTAEPVVEPKVEPTVPQASISATEVADSLKDLGTTIASALAKAEELKEQKRLEAERQAQEQAEQARLATEARVKDAIAYIQEQASVIASTDATQLNFDDIEAYYEAVSTATEVVNAKILEISAQVQAQA